MFLLKPCEGTTWYDCRSPFFSSPHPNVVIIACGEDDSIFEPIRICAMANEQAVYHPKDAIAFTTSTTFQIGMAGLAVAAVQNALRKENIGAKGVLTRSGGTIVTFGTDIELAT